MLLRDTSTKHGVHLSVRCALDATIAVCGALGIGWGIQPLTDAFRETEVVRAHDMAVRSESNASRTFSEQRHLELQDLRFVIRCVRAGRRH